jgi:putative membrane protein
MGRWPIKGILAAVFFAAGVAATLWLLAHFGMPAVRQALGVIGARGVLLLALIHLPTLAVLGLAWSMIGRGHGTYPPVWFVWALLMRDSAGALLPFSQLGGLAIGARALHLRGVPGRQATVTSIVDALAEQVAKAPYALAAVALLLWLAPASSVVPPALAAMAASLVLLALLALRRDWVHGQLRMRAAQLHALWRVIAARPGPAAADVEQALAPRVYLGGALVLHLCAWLMGAAETWVALRLIGAPVGAAQALVIDGVFVTVRSFAFAVPGALGVQEGAYVVLCGLFGVAAPMALALSLVQRARDLLIGAPAVLAWQALEQRRRVRGVSMRGDARAPS